MSFDTFRLIALLLSVFAFMAVVWWAYGARGTQAHFDEAAHLPFLGDDDEPALKSAEASSEKRKTS